MAKIEKALTPQETNAFKAALEGKGAQMTGKDMVDAVLKNTKLSKYAAENDANVDELRSKLKKLDAVDFGFLEKAMN